MVRLLIIYDVSSKSSKIHKYLKSIGSHIQESVFEVEAENRSIDEISQKISSIINKDTDKVAIYNLGDTNKVNKIVMGVKETESLLDKGYLII